MSDDAIPLPRSWPKSYRDLWETKIPRDVQFYIAERETEREAVVRRAQNDKAIAEQKFAALLATVQSLAETKTDDRKESHGLAQS